MAQLNHAHEEAHEIAQPAARPVALDRVDAPANAISRGGDPETVRASTDPARTPERMPARRARRPDPTFSVSIGDGLTDDELVDRLAHLLLAVSCERPAIASASGASSLRAIGGEEPNHGNG